MKMGLTCNKLVFQLQKAYISPDDQKHTVFHQNMVVTLIMKRKNPAKMKLTPNLTEQ
jgi:hypothetical protein